MLQIERYTSNFTCARYYFLYVEFSDFYVNQSLAGQTRYISYFKWHPGFIIALVEKYKVCIVESENLGCYPKIAKFGAIIPSKRQSIQKSSRPNKR
jgi:hypothetical protein